MDRHARQNDKTFLGLVERLVGVHLLQSPRLQHAKRVRFRAQLFRRGRGRGAGADRAQSAHGRRRGPGGGRNRRGRVGLVGGRRGGHGGANSGDLHGRHGWREERTWRGWRQWTREEVVLCAGGRGREDAGVGGLVRRGE